jgi:hypothetical protein
MKLAQGPFGREMVSLRDGRGSASRISKLRIEERFDWKIMVPVFGA